MGKAGLTVANVREEVEIIIEEVCLELVTQNQAV